MKNRPFAYCFSLLAALLLTLGVGFVHGHLRQRWGDPLDRSKIADRLKSIPAEIGPWRLVQETELSDFAQSTLQCYGHVGRTYRNQQTGVFVTLSIIAGPPGPTSVHTPEICMGSQDYKQDLPRREVAMGGGEDRFWNVTFLSTDVEERQVRVIYGWKFDGSWTAAEQPRITFGWRPYLYKLQVSCVGDESTTREACQSFLNEVLAVVDENLPQR